MRASLQCKERPKDSGGLPFVPKLDPSVGVRLGRVLVCRACGTPITADALAVAVEGSAVHRRVNPAGIPFDFGTFREAPGAASAGEPTPEHSWFRGYIWSYALCRGCLEHLGWFFEGTDPSFFGLILVKLREE